MRDRRLRARWAALCRSWSKHVTVGVDVLANRDIMMDEPRLRAVLERDLRGKVEAAPTPARWRFDNAVHRVRWALSLTEDKAPPWEYRYDVMAEDLIERNMVRLSAVKRRIPVTRT